MTGGHEQAVMAGAQPLGWELERDCAQRLIQWLERLLRENARVNLTGVRSLDEGIPRLVLDSLALGLHIREHPLPSNAAVLDLGTGGGIPGVPLSIALPDLEMHLVESRQRKSEAVRRIAENLGLRLHVHRGRLSDLMRRKVVPTSAFGLITSRAVGPLESIVKEAAPALAPGGVLVCWKSRNLEQAETTAGERAAQRAGLIPLPELVYDAYKPARLVRYAMEPSP